MQQGHGQPGHAGAEDERVELAHGVRRWRGAIERPLDEAGDAPHVDLAAARGRANVVLSRMVDAGLLGRKAGRGFYDYSKK